MIDYSKIDQIIHLIHIDLYSKVILHSVVKMKYIFVLIAIAIAVAEAAIPQAQNLCDRIKCDTTEKALTCSFNGKIYKAFQNPCEMRIYNCNKGERFAAVDNDVCKIVSELGFGFFV